MPAERRRAPKRRRARTKASVRRAIHVAEIVGQTEASLLDLVDNLLSRGVMISGEVVLGVGSVDLIYLRLMALLCATDRLFPEQEG